MPFQHRVTARFSDIDRAGIVFFSRFYEYCHAAFEALLMEMFGNLEESFTQGLWMMPLVHSEADYVQPVRMGEELTIDVRVARVGATSITFAYDVHGGDRQHRARLQLVHVFVQSATFKPHAMPEAFAAGLARVHLWSQPDLSSTASAESV